MSPHLEHHHAVCHYYNGNYISEKTSYLSKETNQYNQSNHDKSSSPLFLAAEFLTKPSWGPLECHFGEVDPCDDLFGEALNITPQKRLLHSGFLDLCLDFCSVDISQTLKKEGLVVFVDVE